MPVKNTGLLEAGIRSDFFARLATIATLYPDLCTTVKSTLPSEKYRMLGQVPGMRKWKGGRQAQGLRSESYDVDNEKYEVTMAVDRDEINDDQTGQIRIRTQELAKAAGTHKDYLLSQLLENGGASGYVGYDGLTFFNAAHVWGDSGNQDNDTTSAAATGTDPTVAEFKEAIKVATAALLGFKDDQGRPINNGTGGLIAIVPPQMYLTALEAMNATIISSTTNVMQGLARVMLNGWLSSTDKFYLTKTDGTIRPFIFQDREPIEFNSLTAGSEQEFKYEQYLYGVRARYAITYGEPLTIVRHTFT
jgi:phage major head subunit gpT-like protein